jgi:hypothetical protein
MDDLFWGREYEDVSDWAERLTMAAEVWDLIANKLFKIAKLNLRGRAKDWFRKLQPAPADWTKLRNLIVQKYGRIDSDDIQMKLDAIEQEPRERVQRYFERLDKLFQKGKIPDAEQRRQFLSRLRPEIRKLCIVRAFVDIEELLGAAIELERVLGELGETPFEPLKEEQDEGLAETLMENPVAVLNNALINFLKGSVPNPISSFSPTLFIECQICGGRNHIAMTCPRSNDPRPKCANCGRPHRTESCGVRYSFYSDLGHAEGRCRRKHNEGKSHFEAANFMEVLQNDEATLQQFNKLCGSDKIFSYIEALRRRMLVEVATGGDVPFPGQQEGQVVTPDVEVRIQDLACEQQGWNEGDVEEPIVSAVDSFSKHQAPNNITDMQDKNADVQIPDSRQSASIRAISS